MKSYERSKFRCALALFSALLAGSSSSAISIAQAKGGNAENPGVGVRSGNKYLTLGSANIEVGESPIADPPGIELLVSVIQALPVPVSYKAHWTKGILPNGERQYFLMKGAKTDGLPYAITEGRKTHLSSDFAALPASQKASILFQHSLKSLGVNIGVEDRIIFQRYLEKFNGAYGFDDEFVIFLARLTESEYLPIAEAAKEDYRLGRLQPFLDEKGMLPISVILGRETNLPARAFVQRAHCTTLELEIINSNPLAKYKHLTDMMSKYPEALIFRHLFLKEITVIPDFSPREATKREIGWDRKEPDRRLTRIMRGGTGACYGYGEDQNISHDLAVSRSLMVEVENLRGAIDILKGSFKIVLPNESQLKEPRSIRGPYLLMGTRGY